jgi:hypothetical protein
MAEVAGHARVVPAAAKRGAAIAILTAIGVGLAVSGQTDIVVTSESTAALTHVAAAIRVLEALVIGAPPAIMTVSGAATIASVGAIRMLSALGGGLVWVCLRAVANVVAGTTACAVLFGSARQAA